MPPHYDARRLAKTSRGPRFGPVGEESRVGGQLALHTHFCRGASLARDAAWSWAWSTRRRTRQHTRARPSVQPVLLARSAAGRIATGDVPIGIPSGETETVWRLALSVEHHAPFWLATRRWTERALS